MASYESVESSRLKHQKGMEFFHRFWEKRQIHPIVALDDVHRMIKTPELREEALGISINILDIRLSAPGALEIEEPKIEDPRWLVRHFKRFVFEDMPPSVGYQHSRMWLPALAIISEPINPAELEIPQLVLR